MSSILIASPWGPVGYQLAGAFTSLGKQVTGIIRNADDKKRFSKIPMATIEYDWTSPLAPEWPAHNNTFESAFIIAENNMAEANEPSAEFLAQVKGFLKRLKAVNKNVHIVLALSWSTPSEFCDEVLLTYPDATIFLSPPLYGFNDGALMSQALDLLEHNPAALDAKQKPSSTPLAFVGDLVAFLITTPGNSLAKGKIIEVPHCAQNLEQWRREFVQQFRVRPMLLDKIKNVVKAEQLGRGLNFAPPAKIAATAKALEIFPTALYGLARSLKTSKENLERYPELGLHFRPGRTP
jgi:hypothetical protein